MTVPEASRFAGPVFSLAAVLIGIAQGWVIRSSVESAQFAGYTWLIGSGLIVSQLVSPFTRRGIWAAAVLLPYVIATFITQPSVRTDGNAEAAVVETVVWLIPAIVAGLVMPRWRQWRAAAGCWCLTLALTAAATGTVSHRSSFIGLFTVVWD